MKEITEEEALEAIRAIKATGTKEEIEQMNIILKQCIEAEIAGYEKELLDLQDEISCGDYDRWWFEEKEEEERKLMFLIDLKKLESRVLFSKGEE